MIANKYEYVFSQGTILRLTWRTQNPRETYCKCLYTSGRKVKSSNVVEEITHAK